MDWEIDKWVGVVKSKETELIDELRLERLILRITQSMRELLTLIG